MDVINEREPLPELCSSCRLGNLESVNSILQKWKGIDINKPGKEGMTPLQEACSSGSLEIVKRLIAEGADVNTREIRGFQAIHIAAYNRKQPVVEYLIREGRCSVDTPTSFRETPLHIACLRGPVSMVTFLLGCNADCTSRDSNGNSVLHHAAAGNQRDIVQSVLQHRAELMKAVNNFGQTAAHRAAMLGCYKSMEVLVNKGTDLLAKDMDGHTPHDLANLFQNALCFAVTKPHTKPPDTVIQHALSSNSFLTVQMPYHRSASGEESTLGDRSPKPGAIRRRPSLTGISRPRSMTLPYGLVKKPVYVSGELAENVSRSGSIDWQNVCVEPPPDIQFILPKHQVTLTHSSRQLVSPQHGIKLKLNSSYWKQPGREGAAVEVWLCAGMQSSYTCPRGYFIVSPICFVSCKTQGVCSITLVLPSAVRVGEEAACLLTIVTAIPSNASLRLDSPQSCVGAGTLTPLANSSLRLLPNGSMRFTCQLTSVSLFAVAVRLEEGLFPSPSVPLAPPLFPSPSLPLKCCLTVAYMGQEAPSHVKGFDLVVYVGMRLPSVTTAVRGEVEAAALKHDEKLFDLKAECVTLDVILNRPEEWEITARDSEQINCSSLCISHDADEGFSFSHLYPPRQRFFLDPRQPRASLTCTVRVVSASEELCKVVVTPYNPLRETTPDPSLHLMSKTSSSLPTTSSFGSPPSFQISTEQTASFLAVPSSSLPHLSEHRRGSISPSSSHSSLGAMVREASPTEEGSKLLDSMGSDGALRLSAPCHVSTRETSPNDSDVSRQSEAPLIMHSRVTDV